MELIVRDPNCLVKAYPELTVGFSREDELEICQELISNDYSGYLMENLKKMTRVLPEDYPKIIDIFIKKNKLERLWEYLEKLTGIDPLQYKSILESSVNVNLEVLTKNIHKLKGVDGSEYFETAKKIAERNPEIIKYVNRFAQFNIQERNEILLIAAKHSAGRILDRIDDFNDLSLDIFSRMVEELKNNEGKVAKLIEHITNFNAPDEEARVRIIEIFFANRSKGVSMLAIKNAASKMGLDISEISSKYSKTRNALIEFVIQNHIDGNNIDISDWGINIHQPEYDRIQLYDALPKSQEIQRYIYNNPVAEARVKEKNGSASRHRVGFELAHENIWNRELRSWFDGLVDMLKDAKKAEAYLDIAYQGGITTHDALYFIPHLTEEFKKDSLANLAMIFRSITNPSDIEKLKRSAFSYAHERALELNGGIPIRDMQSLLRICVLIRKNFKYPNNASEVVREKINRVLEGVGDTERLARDISADDSLIVAMLENKFGWDEKALIQPTAEITLRVKPLGPIVQATLDKKSVDRMSGVIGKMQDRKFGFSSTLLQLQKEALFLEDARLRQQYAEFYSRDPQDKELIKIKKNHREYLDSLKIITQEQTGKIGPNVHKIDGRVSRLTKQIAECKQMDPYHTLAFQFETAEKLYSIFSRLLLQEALPGGFKTNILLEKLIEKVIDRDTNSRDMALEKAESRQVFQEQFIEYVDSVLDTYFELADFVSRQVVDMKHLEPIVKKVVLEDEYIKTRNITFEEFLKNPDIWFEKNNDLKEKIANVYEQYEIPLGEVMFARVCAKSDPEAMIAGDETECCMPYGSDKHYDYMYRPDTAIFVVGLRKNGVEKIIAQSVLVAAREGSRIGEESTDYKGMWSDLSGEFSAIAFDNIEVKKSYQQNETLRDIAKIYLKAMNTYFPEKTVILGTTYNDDHDLVSSHGSYVRNTFAEALSVPLAYSDCFGDRDCYKMRGPLDGNNPEESFRLNRITSDGIGETNPIRAQIKADFQMSDDEIKNCRLLLSPTQNRIGEYEGGDPIFEARSVSVRIQKSGKPILFLIALDYGNDLSDEDFDTIAIEKYAVAKGVTPEEIYDAIIEFLNTQEQEDYRIKIPTELLEAARTDAETIRKQLGYHRTGEEGGDVYLYGHRGEEETEEDYDDNEEEDYE